jgi:gliding motility-associatede transport system auxiliary component
MAMKTASPWWASLIYALGLGLLLLGERAFHHVSGVHMFATGLGALLVVGVTAMRAATMLASHGARRRVELALLLCHLGAGLALILYALTTKTGLGWIGYADAASKGAEKATTILTVLWMLLLVASLLPLFMIEASLGVAGRTSFDKGTWDKKAKFDEDAVEFFRVREVALSGLSVALAAAFLMVTCNVAGERNIRRDVSYFKTSQPGDSTINIVKNTAKPLRVLLFFPEVNEVKRELKDYFEDLGRATGGKVTVEVHDRETEPKLAAHYKVSKDGTVVLTNATLDDDKIDKPDKPPKTELLDFDTDFEKARRGKSKLRNLDREINSRLVKLMREKLRVYMTVGHGEMNDPDSVPVDKRGTVPLRGTSLLKRVLGLDQYEIRDLGLVQLAQGVPEDASAVFVLAPSMPLQPEELAALDKYLVKGGHLLIALDPRGSNDLGVLEGRLGVSFQKGILCDDKVFLDRHKGPADHRLAVTQQFSAHASTTSLSRASANVGVLLIEAGALQDHPFEGGGEAPTRNYVIHSMSSSWLDLDENFVFDDGKEKRQRYNLAAAIEGPKGTGDDGKAKDGWKALVYADADLFEDFPPQAPQDLVSGPLIEDATKWLAGESVIAGEVVSEDDVPIQHTRSRDQAWYYVTILGAPALVLSLGLALTLGRRRRPAQPAKPREVAS